MRVTVVTRCFQECPADKIRFVQWAGWREEKAAANRLDVFLERFAIELALDGDEALLQIGLIADEQKPLLKLAGLADAVRIVERAAQDQVGVGSCVRKLAKRICASSGVTVPSGSLE